MAKRRSEMGSKKLDGNGLRELMQKNQALGTSLGIVRRFAGEESHFEIIVNDDGSREVMVDVELIPRGERVACRLGFGGDQIYKIPRVDQEVAVLIPLARNALVADELDADPIIVGVLGAAPAALDDDDIVIIETSRVRIIADTVEITATSVDVTADSVTVTSDDIKLGGSAPNVLDQVAVGSLIEPLTGMTGFALGWTTTKVKAEK